MHKYYISVHRDNTTDMAMQSMNASHIKHSETESFDVPILRPTEIRNVNSSRSWFLRKLKKHSFKQ